MIWNMKRSQTSTALMNRSPYAFMRIFTYGSPISFQSSRGATFQRDAKARVLPITALDRELMPQLSCDPVRHVQPHPGRSIPAIVVVAACVALLENASDVTLPDPLTIVLDIKLHRRIFLKKSCSSFCLPLHFLRPETDMMLSPVPHI